MHDQIVAILAQHMTPEALTVMASYLALAQCSRDQMAASDVRELGNAIIQHLGTQTYNRLMDEVGL
jgi:hypothetical protein